MKILFIGDIVGRAGRQVLRKHLSQLKEAHAIDFTIANIENAAGGFGVTPSIADEVLSWGVDVLTSGNHVWDQKEIFEYFEIQPRLLRPGNYPPGTVGRYQFVGQSAAGFPVAVMNLQGRIFMGPLDCPFRMAEREIPRLAEKAPVIIIDFHAEATSEKNAFGWFVDGKVSAVIGTHTHVPTADARVLPQGTAFISDVGMTGARDSIIGMKIESALGRFLTGLPARLEPAIDSPRICAVVIDVEESTGKARSIEQAIV